MPNLEGLRRWAPSGLGLGLGLGPPEGAPGRPKHSYRWVSLRWQHPLRRSKRHCGRTAADFGGKNKKKKRVLAKRGGGGGELFSGVRRLRRREGRGLLGGAGLRRAVLEEEAGLEEEEEEEAVLDVEEAGLEEEEAGLGEGAVLEEEAGRRGPRLPLRSASRADVVGARADVRGGGGGGVRYLTGRPPGPEGFPGGGGSRPGSPVTAMEVSALPIRRSRRALVEAVREQPFLIVTGETGSGKSTQLPKYLFEAGNGRGGGEKPLRAPSALPPRARNVRDKH